MDRHIWFGTRDAMRWVPAPAVSNYAGGAVNWSSRMQYLNGGAYVRNSYGSHREYSLSWNLRSQFELNVIVDYAQGMYGTGLIYWSDPFAMYTNVVPKDWATPYLAALDGANITDLDVRPTLTATSANVYGFPTQSAVITGVTGDKARKVYIPIPPGHDLLLGAWGSTNSGTIGMKAQQTNQTAVLMVWKPVNDMSMTNVRRFSGGTTGSGIELWINGGTAAASATVTGVMGVIVKEGEGVEWQQFQSGQGHSGCRFEGIPQSSPYSAALDKIGMSAKLVEVGAWQ